MKKTITCLTLAAALSAAIPAMAAGHGDGNHHARGAGVERHGDGQRAATARHGDGNRQGRVTGGERRGEQVDRREAHQETRIARGVARGSLTTEETTRLKDMERRIADAEAACTADGKLSPKEGKELRRMLDEASLQIWAEKHDAEGTAPARKAGQGAALRNEVAARIESGDLTGKEARAMLQDMRQAAAAKRRLAGEDLPAAEREKLQAQFDAVTEANGKRR